MVPMNTWTNPFTSLFTFSDSDTQKDRNMFTGCITNIVSLDISGANIPKRNGGIQTSPVLANTETNTNPF